MTPQEIDALIKRVPMMPPEEREEVMAILDELDERKAVEECREDLIAFCKRIMPTYIVAPHHRRLANLLMDIAAGRKDRITVSVPPRHGKSQLSSILFPAWYLGNNPTKCIIMVSNTSDLATDFGSKVRDIISSPAYQRIFPGTNLSPSKKAAGRWDTSKGGEYFAAGVGTSIAGRGGDIILVDDPHNEQDLLTGNYGAFDKAYTWFTSGLRTRLMSEGKIALIHCMTGDTKVLLADGKHKLLQDIRPGDTVASYEEGRLVPALVQNWANQGLDRIYVIKTISGKIVRANERHPFLVSQNGVLEWTKVKNLKRGMSLIGVSQIQQSPDLKRPQSEQGCGLQGQKPLDCQNVAKRVAQNLNMRSVNADTTTIKTGAITQGHRYRITAKNGGVLNVLQRAAQNKLEQKECASCTTINNGGMKGSIDEAQKKPETHISSIGMELALRNTTACLQSKMENALYVSNPQDQTTPHQIGRESLALTTATVGAACAPSFVTPAISLLARETQKKLFCEQLSTYEPTADEIVDISFAGYEEVFDIQVEGTENFIANGLVSHNTRWHLKDLIGRVVADGKNNAKADQYEVFEFPAILPSGKALWPAKFDLESLERTRASMPAYQWAAQYMQQPTSAEAALIKREWWRPWTRGKPPACEYVIMTLDAAAEKHNRADYSALLTFGVFRDDDLTKGEAHLILLNALNVRVEFPELKALCLREYNDWEPDSFIVEKKSAGTQLYQEFRRQGMPVQEFTPTRATGDKVARVNAITDIISSGMVWYPEGRRWAEDVIEQCVAFPVGDHDDMCLVAGTRIAMADGGTKKIEDVLVGDYVQTPLGAKRVLAAGQTGVAPTIRVAVAGKTIEGTGAHRVATQRGWVRLDSVCLSDRIKLAQSARTASCLSSLTQMLFLKLLSLTAGRIGDTQMQPNRRTDDIFLAAADMAPCIGIFGNTTMALSQPGMTCTTKMRTGVTTTSPIWNYFQNVSTAKNTLSSLQNSIVDPNNWSILRVFVRKLQTGIVAKKVKSGTLKTLLSIFSAAAQPMKRWLKRGKNAGKTHLNYPVFSVVRYLRRLYVELSIAQSRALVERISYENVPQPVYNLTIEDAHCFYANSMLTHNCDCVSLALSRFRQGGFISLPTDHEDKDWQPRRRAAYY